MLLSGYANALQRLNAAITAEDRNATFRAVFESLNWATSIDDRIRKHWAPEGEPLDWAWRGRVDSAELMDGVRFARHRVHHATSPETAVWRCRSLTRATLTRERVLERSVHSSGASQP